jgi:hypothetical protein
MIVLRFLLPARPELTQRPARSGSMVGIYERLCKNAQR